MTDRELMDKYGVSASGLVALIKKLVAQNLITGNDLQIRKQKAVQRDLAREAQFLSGLFICPACGHPSPQPFEQCPACGALVEDFAPAQEVIDSITTSGGHIYVDEVERMARQDEAQQARKTPTEQPPEPDVAATQELPREEMTREELEEEELEDEEFVDEDAAEEDIVDESGAFDVEDEEEDAGVSRTFVPINHEENAELVLEAEEPPEDEAAAEPEEPQKDSTIRTIRSFFSKKFKKKE